MPFSVGRKLIGKVPSQVLALVEVRTGAFSVGTKTIVWLAGIGNEFQAVTGIVNRVRPHVIHHGGQTMPIAEPQRRLQRVITAAGGRLELVDDHEGRKCNRSCRSHLVEISVAEELATG